MLGLILSVTLMAPFPLPSIDGKPFAYQQGQRQFRLPSRFEKVKIFYQERFANRPEIQLRSEGVIGARKLKLLNKGKGDTWVRATLTEGQMETVVDLVPVLQLDEEKVTGNGKPLVEFVLTRSVEVQKSLDSIDHLEK